MGGTYRRLQFQACTVLFEQHPRAPDAIRLRTRAYCGLPRTTGLNLGGRPFPPPPDPSFTARCPLWGWVLGRDMDIFDLLNSSAFGRCRYIQAASACTRILLNRKTTAEINSWARRIYRRIFCKPRNTWFHDCACCFVWNHCRSLQWTDGTAVSGLVLTRPAL